MLALMIAAIMGTAPAGAETLSRFAGAATVQAPCGAHTTAVLSEDMPTPGYENRFRFILTGTCIEPGQAGPLPVRVTATKRGSMEVEAIGWFAFDLTPGDPVLQAILASAAPGEEIRMQWITITQAGPRRVQILIEEPTP